VDNSNCISVFIPINSKMDIGYSAAMIRKFTHKMPDLAVAS